MTRRLPDLCTTAQYEAATPEQQMDFDLRWLAKWTHNAERAEQRDCQADYDDERQYGWSVN